MSWLTRLLGGTGTPRSGGVAQRRRPSHGEYAPQTPSLVVSASWLGSDPALRPDGWSRVVGESYRFAALERHLVRTEPHRYVMAQLRRDARNPHDHGAVAVFVGADHVGYIPRTDLGPAGQSLYKALARLAAKGTAATCWARLTGGTPAGRTSGSR